MRYLIVILFLIKSINLCSQTSYALSDSILPNTKGSERNPLALVNKLTANKESDKEKFDMIFTWVTKNISYDYYSYLAPTGSSIPRIDRILKYKAGICLDYAYLMDTLCELAGITNVSISGYAKDDLFDVNDSIYMDNHAWNAVKLDNYWYVYDITWSSGEYKWGYKKFSSRIIKWRKKIVDRRKLRVITFKSRCKSECDSFKKPVKQTIYTLRRIDKFLLKILSKFKLKKRRVFVKVARPDYYLSNPEVFAITHFPDNPIWSLVATQKNIRTFECDSAYYHLNDSVYIKQIRQARTCVDCDNYFSLTDMNKQKQMKENSSAYNKRNRFITWLSNYNIANIFYHKGVLAEDSLTKVSLLDSSIMYLTNSKNDLYQCLSNVRTECELQRTKNKNKDMLLYNENREHLNFMRSIVKTTYEKTRKIDYFSGQTVSYVRKLRRQKDKLFDIQLKFKTKTKHFNPKEKIEKLQLQLSKQLVQSDSLDTAINNLIVSYNKQVAALSDNIWKKIKSQDSLVYPYNMGSIYRWIYLLDNYKKPIVELRKKINRFENEYSSNLQAEVFTPSDSTAYMGYVIFDLIEKRNTLFIETANTLNDLSTEEVIKRDSLYRYIANQKIKIQENICWLAGGTSKLKSVIRGYKILVSSEKWIEGAIRNENKSEFERHTYINREITRRKRKFTSVPLHNMKVTSKQKNVVVKYKRTYLKGLKDERRKQAKH